MLNRRMFIVVLCVLMSTSLFAKKNKGVEPRVDALEELSLQQQGEIDQNTTDIQSLQSGGGGSEFVVMDSDVPPKQVGDVLQLYTNQAQIRVEIDGEALYGTVSTEGFTETIMFFADPGCTGLKYIQGPDSGNWSTKTILTTAVGDPTARVAYVATGAFVATGVSSYLNNGNCQPLVSTRNVAPATVLGDDLHTLYPPPYTLVKQ